MLKTRLLHPEILNALARAGHGSRVLIADGNYPFATEAAPGWDDATLAPWVAHLLATFGPQRLMWGSDWPVLNLNGDYERWHASAQRLTKALSSDERAAVFGGNAAAFYRLGADPAG